MLDTGSSKTGVAGAVMAVLLSLFFFFMGDDFRGIPSGWGGYPGSGIPAFLARSLSGAGIDRFLTAFVIDPPGFRFPRPGPLGFVQPFMACLPCHDGSGKLESGDFLDAEADRRRAGCGEPAWDISPSP